MKQSDRFKYFIRHLIYIEYVIKNINFAYFLLLLSCDVNAEEVTVSEQKMDLFELTKQFNYKSINKACIKITKDQNGNG